MFPSQPSPSGWNPNHSRVTVRGLTGTATTENTCESICEKDGKLWRDRGSQAYPDISQTDDGEIWVEWEGAGLAYCLDTEEARWLIGQLTAIAEIPAKKMGRPSKGQPWKEAGISKAAWYKRQKKEKV